MKLLVTGCNGYIGSHAVRVLKQQGHHCTGWDIDVPGAWKEVMRSNFAKIDPHTGRANRREDGKILKPQNWEPPRLAGYVRPSSWDHHSDLPAPNAYR